MQRKTILRESLESATNIYEVTLTAKLHDSYAVATEALA